MKTYLEQLDEIPPPVCRLIARTKGSRPRILKMTEIAAVSGLHWRKVQWIASLKSFARVTVEDAEKFRLGCGITPENEGRQKLFIKRLFQDKDKMAELFDNPPDGRPRSLRKILRRL